MRFSYPSLVKRVGLLLNQASRLNWTPEGQAWKSGVLSVASEAWLAELADLPGFAARTNDLKVRIERDRLALQHAESTVGGYTYGLTFGMFAQILIGHAMYNAVVSVQGELSEAERLGIEYGKLLVDVCVGVTIQDLDHGLLGLLNLVEPAGLAWYQTTPDKVRHAWPYLSPDARYHVIRRCVHAYKHIAEYKLGHNNSPQILEEHLPTAETLLGSLPLITWHDNIPDCVLCAKEYGVPAHSLAIWTSRFFPRARASIARQMRTF
ncbi:hypothetical protein NBRC10512_006511 [Rhodotorula toruloides]|uniref:RHTO0S01e03840g1_1 n=2 Tax=Rhodotorula toruloides TaxID=5286 RepID=A0A061ADN5_RHOTO|nr:uncharacterized protein RHTO_01517 [Rhodotorula toruloides NP11]EMS21870.1 hypothetical protein RHTO_01517 [Rhodotorula toruloides NP11]CDR35639.1 RHTO0S01e03840g1_1 [Rhodotorula toruloides]